MKFKEFVLKTLCEANGDPSSKRVTMAYMAVLFVPTICAISIYVAIKNPEFVGEIVIAMLASVCSIAGITAYGKKFEPLAGLPTSSTVTESETKTKTVDVQ